jgi:uncharacterized Rmd1/YagE family protein
MKKYRLTAFYVKNSLNLIEIERKNRNSPLLRRERNLMLFRLSDCKFVGVFSYGVVAILGAESKAETERLVTAFSDEANREMLEPEEYEVIIDETTSETVDFESIRLRDLDPEKILLCFLAASQSIVIDFHESLVDRALIKFETVHRNLADRGKLVINSRQAMKAIGLGGNTVSLIIGKLALLDKPDITWEEETAERLHAALRRQFELDNRFSALQLKISFLQESSKTVLNVLQDRKSAMMEIIIIALIAMEFLFFLYSEFF